MKSKREGSRRTLGFKMMVFVLTLAFPRETAEEMTFGNISEQSVPAIAEKDPFNLTCALQIKNSSPDVALYWLKETAPRICLYSAAKDGYSGGNFSHDVNCCVDPAVKQRRAHHSVGFDGEWLRQNLTVVNASSSDSGTYLCVVATWTRKWVWTIARNVSVEVVNSTSSPGFPTDDGTGERQSYDSPSNALPISLGVIGGVILIGGILGLLYWKKKKAKGNPVEEHPRNQTEMEMEEDDCSPYAVSSRKDLDRNEAMYSVVTFPPETRKVNPTLSDADPASQPGEKVHTVYALLSK